MKRNVLLLFISIVMVIHSNELWNGINIGMTLQEAEIVIKERLEARDITANYPLAGNLHNSQLLLTKIYQPQ
jgi:hypothetical protein